MAKYKIWSASVKFEIALAALKGEMTLNEVCQHYDVSPSQVNAWKKQLLAQGKDIFNKKTEKAMIKSLAEQAKKQKRLYETIGELTVERDFLKKNWERFQEQVDEH